MFTESVDNAVVRYVLDDGTEVAFGFDEAPVNPVEVFDFPIGIQSTLPDTAASDPRGTLEDYDRIEASIESLEAEREWLGGSLDEDDEYRLDEIDAELWDLHEDLADIVYFEWTDYDSYGHPVYGVAYSREDMADQGYGPGVMQEVAEDMARQYAAWASGQCYKLGVQRPDGSEYYSPVQPGFDPFDVDRVRVLLGAHGVDPTGLPLTATN